MVFTSAFGLRRFHDDWVFPSAAAAALGEHRVWGFIVSRVGRHWSPLWNALELVNLKLAGWESDAAIRLLDLACLVAAIAWFIRVGARLRLSAGAIAVGVGVLALHHSNAAALYSFDTYSQCLADLATWGAAGFLLLAVTSDECEISVRSMLAMTLVLVAGVLVKEQGLAGAASLAWLAAIGMVRKPDATRSRRLRALIGVAFTVAVLLAALRYASGLRFEADGEFRLCIACVPLNLVALGGVIALPVRTFVVVMAWRSMQLERLVLAALATGGVVLLLMSGVRRQIGTTRSRRLVVALAGLLMVSGFPVVLLGHVGELYAHTGIFWFALLVSVAVDGWRQRSTGRGPVSWAAMLVAASYVTCLAAGLRANLTDMRATGLRATAWLEQYTTRLAPLRPGSVVLIHGTRAVKGPGEFSLYRLTTPELLISTDALDHRLTNGVTLLTEGDDDSDLSWTTACRAGRAYDLWRRADRLDLVPCGEPRP